MMLCYEVSMYPDYTDALCLAYILRLASSFNYDLAWIAYKIMMRYQVSMYPDYTDALCLAYILRLASSFNYDLAWIAYNIMML